MDDRSSTLAEQISRKPAGVPRSEPGTNPLFAPLTKEWARSSLGARFLAVARPFRDRIAIRLPDRDLTYADLDLLSGRIASFVASRHDGRSTPVALMTQNESAGPATILGTARAGHIAVPLDPEYPASRSLQILADTGAELLICDAGSLPQARQLAGSSCRVATLEEVLAESHDTLDVPVQPDDLLAVIYTSGSSGTPKGVMRTHYGVVHNAMRHTNERLLTTRDRIAQLFSLSFAAGFSNTFATLLNGAMLLPFDLRARGTAELLSWLREQGVTQFHTVPSVFRRLSEETGTRRLDLPDLRLVLLGGERMVRQDLELFQSAFPHHCVLGVGMGASETGHVLGCFFDTRSAYGIDILPAGYPADDCVVQIQDEAGREVPRGTIGEIVIAGDFVSPGYWGQAGRTARAFSSTADRPTLRTYRTGDLGCMLADDCTYHMGRADDRVKVRGYRVEMSEVEVALRGVPGIREAAVTTDDNGSGEASLVACVVTGPARVTAGEIRSELRKRLPRYMIPSRIVVTAELPRLPNGKIDASALRLMRGSGAAPYKGADEPRYILEAQLRSIWEEILDVRPIDRTDDFYDLGGDSITAIRMFEEAEDACQVRLSPPQFLTGLTIERLCEEIVHASRDLFTQPIVRIQDGSSVPFFFHNGDLETGGLYCRNLARHVGKEIPFYSLMSHGLFGDGVPRSAGKMADDFVERILQIQPEGPYHLGGFCFGGAVALEIAHRLKALGHSVDVVMMIDTRVRSRQNAVGPVLRALWHLLPEANIAPYGVLRRMDYLARRTVRKGPSHILRSLSKRRADRRTADDGAAGPAPGPRQTRGVLDDGTRFQLTSLALRKNSPERYEGRVVLFYSSHVADRIEEITERWRQVAPQIEVEAIDGSHRSCVTQHVAGLADRMRRRLHSDGSGPSYEA